MATPQAPPVLEVHGLTKHFSVGRRQTLKAVDDVSFDINSAETLGLVGESGSGKTTVGRNLIRLQRPTAGRIAFEGVDIAQAGHRSLQRHVRRRMSMIFQNPSTSLNPYLRLEDALVEPLKVHGEGSTQERRARAAKMLELVGLGPELATRYPQQLSGGQRQRVGIARALMLEPSLVIADEPTSSLDVSVQAQIVNLLRDLQLEFNLAFLFISHDLALVRHISHRIAVMYLGRIMEIGPAEELFTAPLHPYTGVLASMQGTQRERIVPVGDIPSPIDPPSGCVFRTRCPIAEPRCAMEVPRPVERRPGHVVACHHPGELILLEHEAASRVLEPLEIVGAASGPGGRTHSKED